MRSLFDRIEEARLVQLEYGPDVDGYHETHSLSDDERQEIVNALRQLEQKLALIK